MKKNNLYLMLGIVAIVAIGGYFWLQGQKERNRAEDDAREDAEQLAYLQLEGTRERRKFMYNWSWLPSRNITVQLQPPPPTPPTA